MQKEKVTIAFCASLFLLLSAANVNATQASNENTKAKSDDESKVAITWQEPEKYADTRSPNMSRDRHREYIFEHLEAHLTELSETLPKGQSLKFTVTDLDLAGRVESGRFSGLVNTMNDIRIMRDIDIPRIAFDYQLIGMGGEVLKSESVKLKDMNYLHNLRIRRKNEAFAYEKQMLTDWFEDNFEKDKT